MVQARRADLHDAIEQVCGMVQARRADDERSMAQRQNRDAGKVEKSYRYKSPSSGSAPRAPCPCPRSKIRSTPRRSSGARAGRSRRMKWRCWTRAAEVGAQVRAAALSLFLLFGDGVGRS